MDHDWGPQAELYLRDADFSDDLAADIRRVMADELPFEIAGYPTHFATPEVHGGFLTATNQRPISHKVHVSSTRRFFGRYLGLIHWTRRGSRPRPGSRFQNSICGQ